MGGVGAAQPFIFEPLLFPVPATAQWLPRLGRSFQDGPECTEVALQPNAVWHDGRPFSSEDVRASFLVSLLRGSPLQIHCRAVECPSPTLIRFHWRSRSVDTLSQLLGESVQCRAGQFPVAEEVAARFLAAGCPDTPSWSEELRRARDSLLREHPALPCGTGPFRLTRLTASDMLLQKWQRHPQADRVPVDEVRLGQVPSNDVLWALLLSGKLDFAACACPADLTAEILRRQPELLLTAPTDGNEFGLAFNVRRLPNRSVRQGLACALDRDVLRRVAYPQGDTLDSRGVGVTGSRRSAWLSAEALKRSDPLTFNPTRAEGLLREGGLTRVDGRWRNQRGQPLRLSILCRSGYSDLVLLGEAAASQWRQFGLETTLRVVPADLFPQMMRRGEFDATASFGISQGRYLSPLNGLERFLTPEGELHLGIGLEFAREYELWQKLQKSASVPELRAGVETMARSLDEACVYVPVLEKHNLLFYRSKGIWPAPSDPIWSGTMSGAESCFINAMLRSPEAE